MEELIGSSGCIVLQQSIKYRYNLYDEIEEFGDYAGFIEVLANMTPQDTVDLHINSPGGRIDIGMSLVKAIQNTKAKVSAIVEGPSYSMASMIAVACDSMKLEMDTFLMFHNYSTGSYGKGAELMDHMVRSNDQFHKFFTRICSPFLSKREVSGVKADQDVYIHWDDMDLQTRVSRHFAKKKRGT